MPLQALSQNYHTKRNVPYNDNTTILGMMRSAMWNLKAAFKDEITTGSIGSNSRVGSTVWTHVASCDSTTVSSVTDLWGSTYTPAALVWAASGVAHSWIHLRNAALGLDIVIECNTNNTAILVAAVPTSRGFTGGTTTTRPINSTYEVNAGYTNSSTGNWFTWQADTVTGNSNYCHYTVGADGSFYFVTSRNSLGFPTSFFAIQKPQNSVNWPANVADTGNVQLMIAAPSVGAPVGPFAQNTLCVTAAGCIALLPNETRPTAGGRMVAFSFGGTEMANSTQVTDWYAAEFACLPVPIQQWTTTVSVTRGVLRDWWIHCNRGLIPNGTVNDPSGIVSHIVFGDFFLPWNGPVPLM